MPEGPKKRDDSAKENELPVVISASRRTDLVAYYPDGFIRSLSKFPAEKVHTIVIWTKNPFPLLRNNSLRDILSKYSQIYLHLTVTGMGGTILEPAIPGYKDVLKILPELISFADNPRRLRIRFDPIVNLRINGKPYTNFKIYKNIAPFISTLGIEDVSISWMAPYSKVINRLNANNISRIEFDKKEQSDWMIQMSKAYGLKLHFCCVERLQISRCIDGELLNSLHPRGLKCSTEKAIGQRELCGCTRSIDVGWYSQICQGGCVYCYARP